MKKKKRERQLREKRKAQMEATVQELEESGGKPIAPTYNMNPDEINEAYEKVIKLIKENHRERYSCMQSIERAEMKLEDLYPEYPKLRSFLDDEFPQVVAWREVKQKPDMNRLEDIHLVELNAVAHELSVSVDNLSVDVAGEL